MIRFGFDTKEKLIKWVKENVTYPAYHYCSTRRWSITSWDRGARGANRMRRG